MKFDISVQNYLLMCQIFMNDLFTEQGQQRSKVISGQLSTLLKGLQRIETKFNL